jgi:hypothetical protein
LDVFPDGTGLRFSGKNMNPLPCWLGGAQNGCLNFSDCDQAVQLHFALFNGSGGFILKPSDMRFVRQLDLDIESSREGSDRASCGSHTSAKSTAHEAPEDQMYWPLPRNKLDRTSIEFVSLHHCIKVGAAFPC